MGGAGVSLRGLIAPSSLDALTSPHSLNRLRKKGSNPYVIPSEARNFSFLSWSQIEERFLASLRMTK
jgi:hypothetical protein